MKTLRVSTLLLVAALVIVPLYGPRLLGLLPVTHDLDPALQIRPLAGGCP